MSDEDLKSPEECPLCGSGMVDCDCGKRFCVRLGCRASHHRCLGWEEELRRNSKEVSDKMRRELLNYFGSFIAALKEGWIDEVIHVMSLWIDRLKDPTRCAVCSAEILRHNCGRTFCPCCDGFCVPCVVGEEE